MFKSARSIRSEYDINFSVLRYLIGQKITTVSLSNSSKKYRTATLMVFEPRIGLGKDSRFFAFFLCTLGAPSRKIRSKNGHTRLRFSWMTSSGNYLINMLSGVSADLYFGNAQTASQYYAWATTVIVKRGRMGNQRLRSRKPCPYLDSRLCRPVAHAAMAAGEKVRSYWVMCMRKERARVRNTTTCMCV